MLLVNLKQEYVSLSIFIVISIILSIILLFVSYTISYKKKNDVEKLSAYECGFDPFGSGISSFEVHFYIVGILFIIFDLEIIFLYPWAVYLGVLGGSGFCAIIGFLGILTVGFIYEWKKGALDWSNLSIVETENLELLSLSISAPSPKVACYVNSGRQGTGGDLVGHAKLERYDTGSAWADLVIARYADETASMATSLSVKTFNYKHTLTLYFASRLGGKGSRREFFGSTLLWLFLSLSFFFGDLGLLVVIFLLLILSVLEGKDYTGKGFAGFFPRVD